MIGGETQVIWNRGKQLNTWSNKHQAHNNGPFSLLRRYNKPAWNLYQSLMHVYPTTSKRLTLKWDYTGRGRAGQELRWLLGDRSVILPVTHGFNSEPCPTHNWEMPVKYCCLKSCTIPISHCHCSHTFWGWVMDCWMGIASRNQMSFTPPR